MTGQARRTLQSAPGDGGSARALRVRRTDARALRRDSASRRRRAMIGASCRRRRAIRSGDLGEIYATEWIDAHRRLSRADQAAALEGSSQHGDARRRRDRHDLQDPATQRLRFLKTEAKSRIDSRAQTAAQKRAPAWTRTAGGRPRTRCPSYRPGCLSSDTTFRLVDAIDEALLDTAFPSKVSDTCCSRFRATRHRRC